MSKSIADLTDLIFTYYPSVRKVFRNLVSIKGVPISMTQLTCLNILNKQDRLTMSELADDLNMSNQQLTKVVDALVDFDMAKRSVEPSNRRKIYAEITEKGKETLSSLRQEVDRKLTHILRKTPDDELDKLYESIAHIAWYFGYKDYIEK